MVDSIGGNRPLAGFSASNQFCPEKRTDRDVARNINAAFLILLSGPTHPLYNQADDYLRDLGGDTKWAEITAFFGEGIDRVRAEVSEVCRSDEAYRDAFIRGESWCRRNETGWGDEAKERVWGIFFPEGAWCLGEYGDRIDEIRGRRRVRIVRPNPDPVHEPARQLLFMSNILVTMPQDPDEIDSLPYSPGILNGLRHVLKERQRYWFDHPIQIGVRDENNEAVYGLRGLNDAMIFEKERGVARPDDKLTCLLSVSVTHDRLHRVVKDYLREVYAGIDALDHLRVCLFSEVDTRNILKEIILPGAERYLGLPDGDPLRKIFGVDGEYGRHFSFLKAISAFWKVLVDPDVKGSFKLDLDQVFDQEVLVRETGRSALEHFATPLWGGQGTDVNGNGVELGLMAGALVNQGDIGKGLFTPDVPIPDPIPAGEALIFFGRLPMAISTRAEMMTRYDNELLDGERTCIQRIHITGGTSAVLVRSLRKYRPFTPSFIGRAEDQAYLLSCLFRDHGQELRYLHNPGLIMRHDKDSFAGQAIEGARLGKYVGDLVRTLLFTYYAHALPWPLEKTKEAIDPFTGCFMSRTPLTVVYLRLAFTIAGLFDGDDPAGREDGVRLMTLAVDRLLPMMRELIDEPDLLVKGYQEEKAAWDMFYDVLDHLERGLVEGDVFAMELREKARRIVDECMVEVG